ncbi:hypothetical protein [Turicimonas muris]|uniref:hypothetical protein n=1 Tax=Turicimonas muris TaxID=1796652 RepID=UPI00248BECAA|nr:hypothetical protein [Turicimonas muris]
MRNKNEKIIKNFVPYENQELQRGDQIRMWFNPDHKILVADVLYKVRNGVWAVWIDSIGGQYQVEPSMIRSISKALSHQYAYSQRTLHKLGITN